MWVGINAVQNLMAQLGADDAFLYSSGTAVSTGRGDPTLSLPSLRQFICSGRKYPVPTSFRPGLSNTASSLCCADQDLASRCCVHSGSMVKAINNKDGVKLVNYSTMIYGQVVIVAYPQILQHKLELFQNIGALEDIDVGIRLNNFALLWIL